MRSERRGEEFVIIHQDPFHFRFLSNAHSKPITAIIATPTTNQLLEDVGSLLVSAKSESCVAEGLW